MKELIEMRIEDPILPMEAGFGQLLKAHGEELPDDKFALFMNAMYSVDAYIRDYFRKAAVDELVRAKIPVRLVGEGWEKYESCNEAYVTREKAVVFGLSFEKIAHADVLLNVSPFLIMGRTTAFCRHGESLHCSDRSESVSGADLKRGRAGLHVFPEGHQDFVGLCGGTSFKPRTLQRNSEQCLYRI